ncbi:MAG: TIGR03905 family TSCPD domain-containing protein [Clostridia bacterium]|nr:TIGR03905 family TSCPD domain-containing protein [Clostridia bacterium]
MKHYEYITKGVCSRKIDFDIEEGIIKNVSFLGGCNGNTQGICKLVEGMKAEEVAERLKGLNCNGKGTSCPDQLAIAITKAINE